MLCKQNGGSKLSEELFQNPTSEFRGTPFWAWNCELDKDEMTRQMGILQEMGFGGFHIHVRTGLATPYLSDEFMGYVDHCVKYAEQNDMLAWLYDEDRWPSGAGGGLVTKDERFRARHLLFTPVSYEEEGAMASGAQSSTAAAHRAQNGKLLACYDVELDATGNLKGYRCIGQEETARGVKWYAYLEIATPSGWFNNQTYVNTLDKKAIDRFIEVTHETYRKKLSDAFGKSIPAIFTDEPQFTRKEPLRFAHDLTDVFLPWTDDLPETFREAYGEDLIAHLPELVWDLPAGEASVTRYHFHDHVCERFTEAFADNCGRWCRENGLKMTGHMMEEPTLHSQTAALGEAMRSYRGFDLPGIDMLSAWFEYTTAKQAQSTVHQFGYEGMTSELYGVTNWDFDFRSHKLHGDWQAALGVTVRVHHLSWMSMAGEAKRDYPASISYQSPWWKEYSAVEDHFSRLNTVLTRGKPVVRVGVVHPIESYWLHWGPEDVSSAYKERMDKRFQNLTEWLLFGMIDFDFISESLLPDQCEAGGAPLHVGEMQYDAIIVPCCETLRSSTMERLEAFKREGGKLIFMGSAPHLEDAKPSIRGAALYEGAMHIEADQGAILEALEPIRFVEARNETGHRCDDLIYQLREDNGIQWLFIAHAREPYNLDICKFHDVRLTIQGHVVPVIYDTQTGEHKAIAYHHSDDTTQISVRMYDFDSLLLRLEPATAASAPSIEGESFDQEQGVKLPIAEIVDYKLSEPNAMLLDFAQCALDDAPYGAAEELLRADNCMREYLGWPGREEVLAQPWVTEELAITHHVKMRFTFYSDIELEGAQLAIEDAERAELWLNGSAVPVKVDGWYADRSIKCVALPKILKGENILEIRMPFGRTTNVEWVYLLGDFGVSVYGRRAVLTQSAPQLGFGDICLQGLPFYGGNITYRVDFESTGGRVQIQCPHYRGALLKMVMDDEQSKRVIYPPYYADFGVLPAGKHTVEIILFGHRRNGFGPVHLADLKARWIGPNAWRTTGDEWSESYQLCRVGILSEPRIFEVKE